MTTPGVLVLYMGPYGGDKLKVWEIITFAEQSPQLFFTSLNLWQLGVFRITVYTLIYKIKAVFFDNAFRNQKNGRIDMKFREGA